MNLSQSKMIKLSKIESNKGQIAGLPRNPRLIKNEKFERLKKSIEENPEMLGYRELLVYPHGEKFVIIGGNMRYLAMKELGYKEAPCKVISEDATPEQLKAYTIKDNAGFGEWDFEMLANEWEDVKLVEWGVDVPCASVSIEAEDKKEKEKKEEEHKCVCCILEETPHYCDEHIARWEAMTGKKAKRTT